MSEYNRHKYAMEWMHGGGRDPHGRGLDEEIKIGKEDWLERQRVARFGTQETYSAPVQEPMPNWRDLIREEGVQVGEQVAQGGRIGLQRGQLVGTPTKEVTQYGRRIYETPEGEEVSEKSTTFFINGMGWINIPSIHGGRAFNDDQLRGMIKRGVIEPTSVHQSKLEAEEAAGSRSNMMKRHEKGFAGGQLVQPGSGRQGFKGEGSGRSHWIYEPGSKNQKLKKEI